MRSSIFVLTLLVLAGFGDVRTVSAKTSGPDIAPISEFSSRGFAWFFSMCGRKTDAQADRFCCDIAASRQATGVGLPCAINTSI
jgi:hypothetical protein